MTFDITADISRQRTRDGRKVLAICDSSLNEPYPVVAWIDGEPTPYGVTRKGMCFSNGQTYKHDLHTLPEPLPLIVSYHNVYPEGFSAPLFPSTVEAGDRDADCFATIKTVYDPNKETVISTVETVWRKGE